MRGSLSRLWALGSRLPAPVRRTLNAFPGVDRLRRSAAGAPRGAPPRPGALRPVVYLPTWLEWDVMRQRPQYILEAFARLGHDVWFVDPRAKGMQVVDGVTVVPGLDAVPGERVILYVHFAPVAVMRDRFRDAALVYDILDDLSIYEPDERHLPPERTVGFHHPDVVAAADVVVVSAEALARRHRSEAPELILVRNGVDPRRFTRHGPMAQDLPSGRPVVGYHGAVAQWLDFALLDAVAAALPDHQFVFVGPVLPAAEADADALARRDNVTLLGERSPDVIASYVRSFDVGIVPFVVDDLTAGVSPLKMYEYLACGVPCVATPLPECVAEPAVVTAPTAGEFAHRIVDAIAQSGDPERRHAMERAASGAGWESRVEMIRAALAERGLLHA